MLNKLRIYMIVGKRYSFWFLREPVDDQKKIIIIIIEFEIRVKISCTLNVYVFNKKKKTETKR